MLLDGALENTLYITYSCVCTQNTYARREVLQSLLACRPGVGLQHLGEALSFLSPSNSRYDKVIKFNRYLKAGIIEYWIVDLVTQTLAVNILKDNNYITHIYTGIETVNVHVLEGCIIKLSEVFTE